MAKKKSKKGLLIIIGVFVLLATLVAYIAISKKEDGVKVQTSKVEKRTLRQIVNASGRIQPETEVKVSSETSGEIVYLGVKEGDTVSKNQILVRIKPDIIQTQLEQSEASVEASKKQIDISQTELTRLEKDYKRMKDLVAKEFVSKKEFEAIEAQYKSSEASLSAVKSRYKQSVAALNQVQRDADRTSIYAPIDGIVTKLNVELGEKVVGTGMMAGTELLIVSDMNIMNAEVSVDENDIVMVAIGDTTTIEVDAFTKQEFLGTVFEIGHSAMASGLGTMDQVTNFLVKVRILDTDARFRPGMSCNANIETEVKHDVLSIPLQAVTIRDENFDRSPDITEKEEMENNEKHNQQDIEKDKKDEPNTVVFVLENNKAKQATVKTGVSEKGFIEILSGLDEDANIISGPFSAVNQILNDGDKVIIDTLLYKFKKK